MRVRTFYLDEPAVEGTLIKVSGTACTVELEDGHRVMRHITRVTALDDEARKALNGDTP